MATGKPREENEYTPFFTLLYVVRLHHYGTYSFRDTSVKKETFPLPHLVDRHVSGCVMNGECQPSDLGGPQALDPIVFFSM